MSGGEDFLLEEDGKFDEVDPVVQDVLDVENNEKSDDKLPELEGSDETIDNERTSASEGKIASDELPHSENTSSFRARFESEQSEKEENEENPREEGRTRRLTEGDDGPIEGIAMTAANKFEQGNDSSISEEENHRIKEDLNSVECGTAAARRKALEDYAEETKKSHASSSHVLEDDALVLQAGKAANTRAELEKLSSVDKVFEKPVDKNIPKSGTASAQRAMFEERAKKASIDEVPRQHARTARRSKWPEPNTNYRHRRGDLRKSVTTDDEESTSNVDRENAKNIEKSRRYMEVNEDTANFISPGESSSDEALKSPVKTAEIRHKFMKMLSNEDERAASPQDDLVPSLGTARNLRAKFEAKKDETRIHSKQPSIVQHSGRASRVKERFESGEVTQRPVSDVVDGSLNTSPEEPSQDIDHRGQSSNVQNPDADETNTMSRSAKELKNRFENPSQTTPVVRRNFVVRPKQAGNDIASKFNKPGNASNKCKVCDKTVYPMEMIKADGMIFHKKCFKCAECKATLRLGNYAALQGQFYCKPHFKQLFKKKGNYDEGFGRQQHKKNWEAKPQDEDQKAEEVEEVDGSAKVNGNGFPEGNGYDNPEENGSLVN